MKVTKLPIDTGLSGWNEILPPPSLAKTLANNVTADWLIIGGGFAGLSAAFRLHQLRPSEKIVLLDACRIGEGPAGRNSGFMIDLPHDLSATNYTGNQSSDLTEIEFNRAAIDYAQQIADTVKLDHSIFNRCGKINAAATDKGSQFLSDYSQHLTALGESHHRLDARQLKEITGTHFYQSGLLTPGTAIIQPAAYVRGIAQYLNQYIDIFENSAVVELNQRTDSYLAKTQSGSISAGKVILAVNGHTQSFGFFEQELMHLFTYASMTRALSNQEKQHLGGQQQWNIIPADPMGTTARKISNSQTGDRIIIRNRFTYEPSIEVTQTKLNKIINSHQQSFVNRFPMLKQVEMQYSWAGRLCLSRNNVPAFGQVQPNLFVAACQNGLGTTKGTLAGMLAADLACNQQSELLTKFTAQAQPQKKLPEALMALGANTLIKIKEFNAKAEL